MPTKSTTLDEALLRTLAVRKRLIESKLIFFAQLRFARDTKVKTLPTQKAVREALAVARKRGLIVRLSTGRYDLAVHSVRSTWRPLARWFHSAT